MRAELHVDGLAVDLVGPLEVRAVTLGRIAVSGALRVAALHHSLQDGTLQEIVQFAEVFAEPGGSVGRLRPPGPGGVLCVRA